jgi:hypothetical protein
MNNLQIIDETGEFTEEQIIELEDWVIEAARRKGKRQEFISTNPSGNNLEVNLD